MGENKRYYWLKLPEDFFDDDTTDFIESQENGEKYCLFYLKLCLKALKYDGKLIRYVGNMLIPYDEIGLAKLTKTDVDTVRSALAIFSKIGLVERLDTGEIFLSQLNEMVGTETQKAKYMRQRRLQQSNNVTPMLPECYTDIDIDTELKKDTDTQIETENECVPSYVQQEIIPKKEDVYIVGEMFNLLQAHNSSSPKHKIPISKSLFNFQCKEGRDILQLLKQDSPENILQALRNYLIVSNMESWKTSFSFGAFCKSFTEYTPEFFDISKYDKETDKEQICDNFIKQMEKEKDFDTGTFWQNRADWLEKGRPQGTEYYKWQKEKWHEMGLD